MEKLGSSTMLVTANQYIEKLKNFAETVQVIYTDYQKTITINAIRAINGIIGTNGYVWTDFQVDNVVTVLQQTAFLELNPSAVPRECCYIVRKNWDNKNNCYLPPTIEFQIEGAGNDTVLRKFGQDVKDIKFYIVYEGDEFTPGSFDGWDVVLPKYRRMFKTNKPEKAVYLIKKNNGEIDVQYSDLEDVKKSLLASARQNGADEKLLRELNKLTTYELLNNEKWLDYKIVKTFKSKGETKTYETPLFNPSYTSPVSMFNMIERKLRNHATRKYPKNFNNKVLSELYEETFEEKSPVIDQVVSPEEKLRLSEAEIQKNGSTETITEPKIEDTRPKIEVQPEETSVEPETVESKETEEEPEKKQEEKDDEPDWDN